MPTTNNKNRITKKDQYLTLLDIITYSEQNGLQDEINYNELRDFINHEIELLENKTATAKKRAAIKKQEGDALRQGIYDILSDTEFMPIDEVVIALNNPKITRNMVTSRLGQLFKQELVDKEMISFGEDGRKATAYKRKT